MKNNNVINYVILKTCILSHMIGHGGHIVYSINPIYKKKKIFCDKLGNFENIYFIIHERTSRSNGVSNGPIHMKKNFVIK